MIWTIEPASPWRITAVDSEAGAATRSMSADASQTPQPSLLDSFDPDDRPTIEAALVRAKEGRPASCACHRREPQRTAGILALAPISRRSAAFTHGAGAGRPNSSHDRAGTIAAPAPDEIVAAWTPSAPVGDVARVVAAAPGTAPGTAPVAANGQNGQTRVVDDGALREFLGRLGHDLRTPLNGVLGMSRLLLDSGLRMDQVDYARAIDTSAEHLLSVIEDLLEFATLDVETPLHPVDFCPRALVEDVAESLAWRAAEKDTEICPIVSASVPELVEGDAARLRQVLGYLVSDGINCTGIGDVVVRVTSDNRTTDDGAIALRFEVAANETAVNERQAPAPPVTESRNTLSETSPRAAVCRHLVSRMGGEVGTQSDGALRTSWFTTRVNPRPTPPVIAPNYVSLIGRRVICVDDHPLSQRVLLERLRGWNLDVEATDEAHSALTLMKVASSAGHPFELAILDLRLPGMDGLSLARLIKSDPVLSPTKLVLLTGYPARGQAALAKEAGIDAYLQKPIREAPLRSTIEMLLGGGHAPARPLLTGRRFEDDRNALRPRVLVAENNPVSQKVAVQMLEKLGCRVDVVNGGAEAVQAIANTPYHLVLMECQLPGMDGIDAARRVRGTEGHKVSPPILALTGDAGEQERDACLAAGMNDFVAKPLRLGTLREKLAQWIEAAPR
jgi:two-component system sensor histidine kinase/response regulator